MLAPAILQVCACLVEVGLVEMIWVQVMVIISNDHKSAKLVFAFASYPPYINTFFESVKTVQWS